MTDGAPLQDQMIAVIRAFGLHQPERTPCGQPVSVSAAHALLELSRAAGLTQTELGTRLRLDKSTISRLVATLEQRGWLWRERATADRRAICLRLTPAGVGMARQLATARAATFAAIAHHIPADDHEVVLRALATLVRAMDTARAAPDAAHGRAPRRRRNQPAHVAGAPQEITA